MPGVVLTANDRGMVPSGNAGATAFMINGGQDRSNQMLYDGVSNRLSSASFVFGVIPTQETVAEANVVTNPYSSQYGSTTGGVINVITKSGSNEFHGELFTYIRNDAFNANTFERNLAGQPRTRLQYNTFGGVVTGRLIRDKLFGVFQYHTNRTASVKAYLGRVPTALEREGDFSQTYYSKGGVPTPVTISDALLSLIKNMSSKRFRIDSARPGLSKSLESIPLPGCRSPCRISIMRSSRTWPSSTRYNTWTAIGTLYVLAMGKPAGIPSSYRSTLDVDRGYPDGTGYSPRNPSELTLESLNRRTGRR